MALPDSPPLNHEPSQAQIEAPLRTFWLPWQSRQCVRMIGRMSFSNVGRLGGRAPAADAEPERNEEIRRRRRGRSATDSERGKRRAFPDSQQSIQVCAYQDYRESRPATQGRLAIASL